MKFNQKDLKTLEEKVLSAKDRAKEIHRYLGGKRKRKPRTSQFARGVMCALSCVLIALREKNWNGLEGLMHRVHSETGEDLSYNHEKATGEAIEPSGILKLCEILTFQEFRVYMLLLERGRMAVFEIKQYFGHSPQSGMVSIYLKSLKGQGLVKSKKKGRFVFYSAMEVSPCDT